jgi:hypothetical protein
MLYLIFSDDEQITWHVGERNPFNIAIQHPRFNIHNLLEVQADSDELRMILANFSKLPHTKLAVQCWFGDLAKMIASSL